ncbi:uncharacterized protein V1513DRAFT_375881 [Lipomyces chichibuensis]|uniref:uncharacterized protein n=1 Tax=Lipomyces chichibuensis TaxID=1546026 RepID=UPI003343990C
MGNILGLSGIKSLSFYTGDNFSKNKNIVDMMLLAFDNGAYGDVLYLYELTAYNGYTTSISLQRDSDYSVDVASYIANSKGLLSWDLLSGTSTNGLLRQYYTDMSKLNHTTTTRRLMKRQGVTCSNSHTITQNQSMSLYQYLSFYGLNNAATSPRSICYRNACVSWSASANFTWNKAAGTEKTVFTVCTAAQFSGEYRGVALGNKTVDFCVSNRANGCT